MYSFVLGYALLVLLSVSITHQQRLCTASDYDSKDVDDCHSVINKTPDICAQSETIQSECTKSCCDRSFPKTLFGDNQFTRKVHLIAPNGGYMRRFKVNEDTFIGALWPGNEGIQSIFMPYSLFEIERRINGKITIKFDDGKYMKRHTVKSLESNTVKVLGEYGFGFPDLDKSGYFKIVQDPFNASLYKFQADNGYYLRRMNEFQIHGINLARFVKYEYDEENPKAYTDLQFTIKDVEVTPS